MKCAVSKQSMWVCQVLIPSVETEVCFLISVSTPTPISTQHDHSWQTNTYHLGYKGESYIPGRGTSITLYTTHWHVQNCCCFLCLLAILMHPDLSLQALCAQVDPTCMATLGWQWLIPDHWFTQRSTHHPQWSVQDNNRHIDSIQYPMSTIRSCMHVPETL